MSQDYTPLITSEYNNAPNFVATVALLANGVSDIRSLAQGLSALFSLPLAVGQQLDFVGQWIGISRVVAGVLSVGFFGFADDASALTFGELGSPSVGGRFIEAGASASGSTVLADPEYRTLLYTKILQNSYNGTLAEFESAISDLIPVPVTVIDPGTHVVTIIPSATIDPTITALLIGYDILPRASGVRYQYLFPYAVSGWTTAGTAVATATTVSKPTGALAWDSSAYLASPVNHACITWTIADNAHLMAGGLATNPSSSPNDTTLTFGLICNSNGFIYAIESGVLSPGIGPYSAGDTFSVCYDGKEAVYLQNGAIVRVTAATPGSIEPMFCLYTPGTQIQNITLSTG